MLAEAIKSQESFKPKEYYIARNEVILRLNPQEPLHIILKNEINRLDVCTIENYEIIEKKYFRNFKVTIENRVG